MTNKQQIKVGLLDAKSIVLNELIGEGNYGKVYKGKVLELNVAVKVLKQKDLTESDIQEFQREAQKLVGPPNKRGQSDRIHGEVLGDGPSGCYPEGENNSLAQV